MIKQFLALSLMLSSAKSAFAATHVPPDNLCQRAALNRAVAALEHRFSGFEVTGNGTSVLSISQSDDTVAITLQDDEVQKAPVDVVVGIRNFLKGGSCEFTGDVTIENIGN